MSEVTQSVDNLISQLCKLPGIGKKSAERLAYHLLHLSKGEAMALADAIRDVKQNVRYCSACYNLAEGELCSICSDAGRDKSTICVVEQPRDLMSLEQTGIYRGSYHVLLGRIAPLEGVGPKDLTIDALLQRVRAGDVKEVIMATNPTTEGDGTALYISNLLEPLSVSVTRLARGITSGSVLEYANREMLSDALSGRQNF